MPMSSAFHEELEEPDADNLAALAEDVVYRVPGCDDRMVRKAIRAAYRDFCRRSCALIGASVVSVSREGCCAAPLRAAHIGCVVDCAVRAEARGRELRADEWGFLGGVLRVSPRLLPEEGELEVCVTCVEMPRIGSERASPSFLQRHGDAVVSGALARLLSMTGRAWSDPQQAAQEATAYENAVSEARARYMGGGGQSGGGLNYMKGGMVL